MGYLRLIFASFLLITVTVSCDVVNPESDKGDDEEGQEETTEPPEYSTEESVEEDITEIYSALLHQDYYGFNFVMMNTLSGDVIKMTGQGNLDHDSLGVFDYYQVQAESPVVESFWNRSYKVIHESDTLIEYLPESELEESFINESIGEAHFLKALAYFDLARSVGGVPIDNLEENSPRATEGETYEYVIQQLQKAINLLPSFSTSSSVSKEAAKALLARCYVYTERWAEAADLTSGFLDASTFSLSDNYSSVFENPDNPGVIFSLEIDNNKLATWFEPESAGGEQYLALHQRFVDEITSRTEDARNELIDSYSSGGQSVYYTTKFAQSPQNTYLPLLRLSEIYLIHAEALANIGEIAPAVESLNKVRTRAGLSAYSPAELTSVEEVIQAIQLERYLEFFAEGHRWFDLRRTDQAEEILNTLYDDSNFAEHKQIFPIPISALENNRYLEQNPGY